MVTRGLRKVRWWKMARKSGTSVKTPLANTGLSQSPENRMRFRRNTPISFTPVPQLLKKAIKKPRLKTTGKPGFDGVEARFF
jgi:hypothetical protein